MQGGRGEGGWRGGGRKRRKTESEVTCCSIDCRPEFLTPFEGTGRLTLADVRREKTP